MSATTTQQLSSGEFCKLRYDTIPVKSGSVNVSFYGRHYGMEMNVEKKQNNENFKTTFLSNNYDRPKTTGECEMF